VENMKGKVNYAPNSLAGGCPFAATGNMRGFVSYPERLDGTKVRERSDSFKDHFSQATLFYNSLSGPEKDHLVDALRFELGKVEHIHIRERIVDRLNHVDHSLAKRVAAGIGIAPPSTVVSENHGRTSPALSQVNSVNGSIKARKIGIIIREGFNYEQTTAMKTALEAAGAHTEIISKWLGDVHSSDGKQLKASKNFATAASVFYDAIFIPGGKHIDHLQSTGEAVFFLTEAFKHCKPIALGGEAIAMLRVAHIEGITTATGAPVADHGVVTSHTASPDAEAQFIKLFITSVGQHRHWERQKLDIFERLPV